MQSLTNCPIGKVTILVGIFLGQLTVYLFPICVEWNFNLFGYVSFFKSPTKNQNQEYSLLLAAWEKTRSTMCNVHIVKCSYCGPHSVSSGLSTVHCTQYVLLIVHCTVSVEAIAMSTEHCSLCTSPSGCSLQCTLCSPRIVHCTHCTCTVNNVYYILCGLHRLITVMFTVHSVLHNIVKCEHCSVWVEAYPGAVHCNVHCTQFTTL